MAEAEDSKGVWHNSDEKEHPGVSSRMGLRKKVEGNSVKQCFLSSNQNVKKNDPQSLTDPFFP